ncbi:sensor histidine kinase [Halorubrum lacusprofundi]|jgi:signal transduction histidine kinase|uniref:histidine kinase n=1 Tax=Halorubrum lacusprofundi (strain ATCC 49239 / DSM 5036 / JCM 8891 / ACAM 34) TaxID=416348 RepID=B9LR81_HALLT|nr:HAMP domain-containing sensor histidine kinase [Halorubrum lacusprofundi]ACM57735.1 histidine kinase [Halorubrum lacusprofundi ATCC 49239]MCG1005668.1 HAMP domain-containing histidine kinase [Halorubrum lacusprofundi]
MTGRYDTRDTREGRLTELLVTLGVTEPDHVSVEPEGGIARVAAALFVSVSGFALLIPNVTPLVSGGEPPIGIALSVLGTVLSVALVLVGGLLYRSTFTTRNAVRIAVWSLFGIVVLGGIMLGIIRYQAQLGTPMVAPTFTVAKVLSIGAVAHVIIGVYDARRVRAQQLANEQRRVSVLNRMIRHNLRNETTVLGGHASLIAERVDDPELRDSAEAVAKSAAVIGGLAKDANRLQAAFERRPDARGAVPVEPLIEDAAEAAREAGAETVAVDVEPCAALADDRLATAVEELATNAPEHGATAVELSARAVDGGVEIAVTDDGPGIHESESRVITGRDPETQLEHASGLGLWIVRATADAFDGWLSIETRRAGDEGASDDETGTTVTIGVPAP